MEASDLADQLIELERLGKQVRIEKFERSQIKAYREFYVEVIEALANHIGSSKDKALSVEAKKLLRFNKVYRKFQWITGLMAAGISLSFVLIIYLYMMKEMNYMYAVSVVGAVGAFFMIRHTQKFAVVLAQEVQEANKICKRLAKMVR